MVLLVIFLLVVRYEASGNPLEVNNDLLNDVDSPEVQGYEVHEKLADRKVEEGRPPVVTTAVQSHSSSSLVSDGSTVPEEQNTPLADYATAGGAATSENYVAGTEVVKIINHKTNSHATPYNSVLSDSIKHTVGDDATFTHKPIIVRDLTLSEIDSGSHNNRALNEEHNNDKQHSPGVKRGSEESSPVNTPVVSTAQSSIDSDRIINKEVVHRPYHSSHGSQAQTGLVQHHASPHSDMYEDEAVVQTTVSPRLLLHHNPFSAIQHEAAVIDTQRGNQEGYSRNDENEDEFKSKKSLSTPMQPFGRSTPDYLDHSANGDRISLFPSQPPYVLDQNIYGRYPSGRGEYILNQNGFSNPYLSPQFNLESYSSRLPYKTPYQPTLHHVEHSLRSPPNDENSQIEERDEDIHGRGISNHNLYFPPYPDNGGFSFHDIPFMRPPPSILPYPREEVEFDISEDLINESVS